jgi:hypothetical protein
MAAVVRATRTWTAAHFATLAVALAVLVWVCRGQWFFGDEWDFILSRGLHHPMWSIWRPHNEHWSTLPILWWRATFAAFGIRTYWPYLLGLFLTHLVVVHSAWRLMRRAGTTAAIATAAALVLALFGAGSENLTWAFQVGFVGSAAAGLLLLLAVDRDGSPRRVAAVAAGAVASLLLSGISVVMVGALGVAALARWGWRKAALATVPAAAVYLLWLKLAGSVGLDGGTSIYRGGLGDIPEYVWGGLSATLGAVLHNDRAGDIALVALIAVVVIRVRAWWRTAPELVALAATAPVMFAVISQGRGAIQNPAAGRYLYLTAVMVLPIVALALSEVTRERDWTVAAVVALCVAATAGGVSTLRVNARNERARELALKGQILTSLQLPAALNVTDLPDGRFSPDITLPRLRALAAKGNVPKYRPTVADIAAARLALGLHFGQHDEDEAAPVGVRGVLPAGATRGAGDCVDLRAGDVVMTNTTARGAFNIRAASLQAFVPFAGGNAGPRDVTLPGGSIVPVYVTIPGDFLLRLSGPTRVCGVAWS